MAEAIPETPEPGSDINYDTPAVLPDDNDPGLLERLDWHLRQIRAAEHERYEIEQVYRAEMDRLRDRRDNRVRIIQSRIEWHQDPVRSWHLAHPDRRTVELPNGTLSLTVPKKPKVFVDDADAVADWARVEHPEILKGPNVTDIRKVVEIVDGENGAHVVIAPETGEVVPGVHAEIPVPSVSIDVEPGSPL